MPWSIHSNPTATATIVTLGQMRRVSKYARIYLTLFLIVPIIIIIVIVVLVVIVSLVVYHFLYKKYNN